MSASTRNTDGLRSFMATMVVSPHSVPIELAEQLSRECYGVSGAAARLTGERDENFLLTASDGRRYVFKIANAAEDESVTDLSTAALLHVASVDPDFPSPRVCLNQQGRTLTRITDASGRARTARLVTYVEGKPLRHAARTRLQRADCGRLAARLGRALSTFHHPASQRTLAWDLRNVPLLRPLLSDLPQLPHGDFVERFLAWFELTIAPQLGTLRQQFIHNDFNDRNILVDPENESAVCGVIDFGDCVQTVLVADVAIAAVAQITDLETSGQAVTDLASAYHEIEPLQPAEQALLGPLSAARIVTGVLIPSWYRARNPLADHYDAFDGAHIGRRIALATRLMHLDLTFD